MRVMFLWDDVSSYMRDCFRELARLENVDFRVFAAVPERSANVVLSDSGWDSAWSSLARGSETHDFDFLADAFKRMAPDLLVISGWRNPAYRRMASSRLSRSALKVLAMDNPRHKSVRQAVAPYALWRSVKNFDAAFVPGDRAARYAQHLGFEDSKIFRGLYAVNTSRFASCSSVVRPRDKWPRRFTFVGRHEKVKGFDLLLRGYAKYRSGSRHPWDLVCLGIGPLDVLAKDAPGVLMRDFVPPPDIPEQLGCAGVLVLPSRYDPWPLVVLEAMATGLPIALSDNCGNVPELLRTHYNGWTFGASVTSVAQTLQKIERSYPALREMGSRSMELAAPYDVSHWTARLLGIAESLGASRGSHPS